MILRIMAFITCCLLAACASENVASVAQTSDGIDAEIVLDTGVTLPPLRDVSISFSVTPNQSTYAINSEIEVIATVTTNGQTQTSTDWSLTPDGFAMRLDDTRLLLTQSGIGTLRLCVESTCQDRSIYVVDSPTLRVAHPARGEMLELDDTNTVMVSGKLENFERGFPTILVNGQPATVDDEFNFTIPLTVMPGLNELTVEVREPTLADPPSLYIQFLAANRYRANPNGTVRIEDAIVIDIHEALLDSDLPNLTLDPGETVVIQDVVQFVDVIAQTSNPLAWLPDPLTDLDGLELEVDSISLGVLDGNITLPGSIAEANFTLTDAQVNTRGQISWMGTNLDLDGHMNASLSAFFVLGGSIQDTIILDLQEIDAEILSVEAHYESQTLNDLVEALDSELTEQIIAFLTDFIKSLFREQALPLVQFSFGAILEQIQVLPIEIPAPIEGVADVSLAAEVIPTALDVLEDKAVLSVDVEIRSDTAPVNHDNDKGVFSSPVEEPNNSSETPLTLVVKLDLLNALCHSVWKTGFLNASPALPNTITDIVGSVRVNALLPPIISMDGANGNLFELSLAEIQLEVTPKDASTSDLYVVHLSVPASLRVDGGFLTLVLQGAPTVRAETLVKDSQSPINSRVIESLLLGVIWPQVESALGEGLTYGIDQIPIDPSILRDVSPELSALNLVPSISDQFTQWAGLVTVGGSLTAEATRRAAPPPNAE